MTLITQTLLALRLEDATIHQNLAVFPLASESSPASNHTPPQSLQRSSSTSSPRRRAGTQKGCIVVRQSGQKRFFMGQAWV